MGATTLGNPDANKGLNGTKKTITDFFGKSPQNNPAIESKPKDLLGYFSKCNNLAEEHSPLTSSPKSHKGGMPVSNSPNSIGSKNKKRKHNNKAFITNDSLDEDDNVKPKKRKCNKKLELFQTDSSPPLKEKNPISGVLMVENENHSDENSKEKTVAGAKETNAKNVQGKPGHRSLAKPKRSDGKTNVYKWTRPLESNVSGNELSSGLCEDLDNDKNTDASKSLELSYEEYLLSQEMDTEPAKIEVEIEQIEDIPENPEDAISASSCQKVTKPTSIATFFSQLPKSVKKETPVSQTVTICADIHPEPREKPPSPIKKHAGSKSQEIVLKPISLDTKSRLKELDSIVVLSSEQPSEIKELPPSDGIKQKSFKKLSATADRAPKKSTGKNKVPSSAPDVKGGKSSQCLLNFGGQKPLMSKPEDGTTTTENMTCSQSTVTSPTEKNKFQSDVSTIKHEEDSCAILADKEIVNTKTSLKRKRVRGKKNSTVTSKENIAMVNKKKKSTKNPRDKNGIKEFQITEQCDGNILDTNVEIPVSKKEEEQEEEIKLDKIRSNEEEKAAESASKEDIIDNSEKGSKRKSHRNTPAADGNSATRLGTRRSARLRDHKTLARPSPTEGTQSQPTTSKAHKEKRKSDSLNTVGPSEKSKEASATKESNVKQDDMGKLAPIFVKKKEKEKVISEVDSEALKLRRAFLMSGLTEEAKRQQQQQSNAMLSQAAVNYPPIPVENHVQQIPFKEDGNEATGLDVWNLTEVSLPGLTVSDENLEVCFLETPEWSCPSSLLRTYEDKEIQPLSNKAFSGHGLLSESDVNAAIKILSEANPSYPVQRFYEMAKTKNKNSLKPEVESTEPKEKPAAKTNEAKGRSVTRRSLGRRKATQNATNKDVTEKSSQKENIDKMDCPLEEKGCDLLWTEKYQPQHSVEVISNCGNLKKLKSWLLEWKQQTDREIRKLKKLLKKQRKQKKSKGEDSSSASSWMDDDSNFETSTSESEDDSICNTMLLTGPHGVGKTSAIYALAAELGYQIFEVNASSARSGKKILTQLQEATQSHQVSKDKTEQTTNLGLTSNLTTQMKEPAKTTQKNITQTSFANFFKSSRSSKTDSVRDSQKVKPETASGKKKQAFCTNGVKRTGKTLSSTLKLATESCKSDLNDSNSNSAFGTTTDKIRKRVNISRTSLILFDEVDVVLEEDKGFWAAIQNFMQSTKRPIILTASSADIIEQFGNCCEHLSFRIPSSKVITSHLQTLCLAENVLTDSSEMTSLVDYFKGDMRLCLLNLQFWINSGGDLTKHNILSSSICHPSDEMSVPFRSCDSPNDKLSTKNEISLTHRHCLESSLGLNPNHLQKLFDDSLIRPFTDVLSWEDLTPFCHHGYQHHFSLLHRLFTSKLPLPRKSFSPLLNRVQLLQKSNKPMKQCNGSPQIGDFIANNTLYDSETSLDEPIFLSIPKPKEKDDKIDTNSQPISCSQESKSNYSACQPVSLQTESLPMEEITYPGPILELHPQDICQQRNCENKILSSMAKFYECSSYNDIFLKSCGHTAPCSPLFRYSATSRSTLTAGLWDELPLEDTSAHILRLCLENTLDMAANLELRTYVNCLQDISQAAENVVKGHEYSISIVPQQETFGLANLQSRDRSHSLAHERAMENVLSNIPLSSGVQHHSLYLEYLPMLREVCRVERTRQLAKMKRRFFHYFDNIGFPLRESTLNVLANGFT